VATQPSPREPHRVAVVAAAAPSLSPSPSSPPRNQAGDYTCTFVHDYPRRLHKTGHGTATFVVGPAREHGWYMTVFEGCG
jgi:hypothetical protein